MTTPATAPRITVATAWLDGCSGCHMSFLDMDERLIDLAQKIDIVYSPLVDAKQLPDQVDLGILEGSISSEDDLRHAQEFRKHCKVLISLGDCAVNGNVPAMRNPYKLAAVHGPVLPRERDPPAPDPDGRRAGPVPTGAAHPRLRAGGRLHPRLPAPCGCHLVCVE